MTKKIQKERGFFLPITDIAVSSLSFFVSYYLRNDWPLSLFLDKVQPIGIYISALPFSILILLVIFYSGGLYNKITRGKPFAEFYLLTKSIITWSLLIMSGSYLYKYDYSRIIVISYIILTFIFITMSRSLYRLYERKKYLSGEWTTNIVIVGTGINAILLAKRIKELKSIGYKLIGFAGKTKTKKLTYLGGINNLDNIIKLHDVNEIYFADPTISNDKLLLIISRLKNTNISFKITSPNLFQLISNSSKLDKLETIPSLDLWKAKGGVWADYLKRVFDIVFSTVIYITTLPAYTIIYLLILTDHGSPVLTQNRVGYKGSIFRMYKFRTMNNNKVSGIGKFLRKTSLDELPQIINVIKGEMSLVGPRPEIPEKAKKHNEWQKMRLKVRPGLTGLWQILGRKDLPLEKNLEYDFYYINNQSFLLDITILLKTIPTVVSGTGAY